MPTTTTVRFPGLCRSARFAWRDPPYEYEYVKRPIDVLTGTDAVRLAIESGVSPRRLLPGWDAELRAFRRRRARYLLYSE